MDWSIESVRAERLPSEIDRTFGWDIIRATADRATALTCISSDLFGIRTHFWRNRTIPCRKDSCEACKAEQLSRWHGYLLCWNMPKKTRVVFEFPAQAGMVLNEIRKERKTLRGIALVAERSKGRINGKVMLMERGFVPYMQDLPKEIDVWPVLSHIWGLTENAPARFAEFEAKNLSEIERLRLGKRFPDDDVMLPPGDAA